MQGALGEGIALMQSELDAISATGAEMGRPYFSALLAEALARAGRPNDGLAEIEKALRIVERDRAYFQLPEIRRLKGELLLLLPDYDVDAVIACFRGAMATASEQGTPLAELRAATSLARVLLHKRRGSEARRLLSEICGRVGGMPDSAELQEARLLLTE
jgi:predicted ATPase